MMKLDPATNREGAAQVAATLGGRQSRLVRCMADTSDVSHYWQASGFEQRFAHLRDLVESTIGVTAPVQRNGQKGVDVGWQPDRGLTQQFAKCRCIKKAPSKFVEFDRRVDWKRVLERCYSGGEGAGLQLTFGANGCRRPRAQGTGAKDSRQVVLTGPADRASPGIHAAEHAAPRHDFGIDSRCNGAGFVPCRKQQLSTSHVRIVATIDAGSTKHFCRESVITYCRESR